MAKLSIKAGSTDVTVYFRVFVYTASNIPQPKTALIHSGFTTYYCRQRTAASLITMATQTVAGAHSDGGLVLVSDANMPGIYRFDLPDAVCATGSPYAIVTLRHSTSTNSAVDLEIELTGWDNQDAVRGGMTALPDTACTTNASLLTSGTGTAQLSVTSGAVNTVTTVTGAVGSVTGSVGSVTGNVGGSVGSVTGAVGSVTGNVGGSVGSVTGAVGSVTGNVGGNVTGSIGSLAAQAKADVNAEVLDVLNTDTFAEPGQGTPAATLSLVGKIGYLFKAWRNKKTQTATEYRLFGDDATTVDQKATVSDDATTTTIGEVTTGA